MDADHPLAGRIINTKVNNAWQMYPAYYTSREGGAWIGISPRILPLGLKQIIEKFHPHSIAFGEPGFGYNKISRWDVINKWNKPFPEIIRY